MELPILISFSGGRTSAFMTKLLMEHPAYAKRDKVVVFANTGKENEATLQFVHECDTRWNLGVVWIEAVIHPEKGVGVGYKIVTFETAARNGEPFEDAIRKYGIPNKMNPHCTRDLKQVPLQKFMKSLGFEQWETAIGIRADEEHRVKRDKGFIYPLVDMIGVDEKFIRDWWSRQSFDLQLKDYQGNCDLCWKKSQRKRLTLIHENPSIADWWQRMEETHDGDYRFDQHNGISIVELIELAKQPFRKVIDKHELAKQAPLLFDAEMDKEWDCFCKST
jgi:hypothetical protein